MIRKVISIMISLLFINLAFTSCNKITKGEIYDKKIINEHSDFMMIPITHTNGKSVYTTMIPIYRYYPKQWVVYIKKYNEDKKDWETADYYVSENCYKNLKIGDYFEYDSENMKSELTYTDEECDEDRITHQQKN